MEYVLKNLRYSYKIKKYDKDMNNYFLAQVCRTKMYNHLMEVFRVIDKDNKGVISKGDLLTAFRKYLEKVPSSALNAIIADIDTNGQHEINYSEFLMMACD